jgi:hypothetical protein
VLFLDGGRELAAGTPAQIVAAVPGSLRAAAARPGGEDGRRAWRRGGRWRVWDPPGRGGRPPGRGAQAGLEDSDGRRGEAISPDLQDAVTIAALARELGLGLESGLESDSAGGMS